MAPPPKSFSNDPVVKFCLSQWLNSFQGNCGVPLQRASRFGSNTSKLSGSHSLLVACLFTNLSILMALKPDLNLMQIATADITIEIPDGFFKEVQVFVNDNHKNKVTVTGDEHLFSLKVLGEYLHCIG